MSTGQKWPLIAELPRYEQMQFVQWLRENRGLEIEAADFRSVAYAPGDYEEWRYGRFVYLPCAAAHLISAGGRRNAMN